MKIWELIFLGLGLSMDAAAVAMSNGMYLKTVTFKRAVGTAFFFGIFQGCMPLIGYLISALFTGWIVKIDHLIAGGLLIFIGGRILYDVFFSAGKNQPPIRILAFSYLLTQSVATSMDALMVGVSFAVCNVSIWEACFIIAGVTFLMSLFSVYLGTKLGNALQRKASLIGGLLILSIGVKILTAK